MHKCLKVLLFVLGGLLLTAFVAFHFVARRDLLGGTRVLRNASRAFEDITIRVHGDNAIKYIEAQTYEGAMYGLGMTHARDRLWQMYFFRLIS
jgi:acyl-homoserine lactone acylase PvdQ